MIVKTHITLLMNKLLKRWKLPLLSLLLVVTIAYGSVMLCDSYTLGFKWLMQNYKIVTDHLRVLKLERYYIILGVDWLRVYSLILFEFTKMKISFKKEGQMIELSACVFILIWTHNLRQNPTL